MILQSNWIFSDNARAELKRGYYEYSTDVFDSNVGHAVNISNISVVPNFENSICNSYKNKLETSIENPHFASAFDLIFFAGPIRYDCLVMNILHYWKSSGYSECFFIGCILWLYALFLSCPLVVSPFSKYCQSLFWN